jgi:flagellar basal body-associated protein FliL
MLKIIVLIMAVILLGGGGFFAWSRLRAADDTNGKQVAGENSDDEQVATVTETLSLGEFLVNLRTSDSTLRYLQTEVSIVVRVPAEEQAHDDGHEGHGGGAGEEAAELPPASHRYARDIAIEVLSSQSFERLRDQADRSKLKARLQQKLDSALESYQVEDVLFTAFVMQ